MITLNKNDNVQKPFPKLMKHIDFDLYVYFEEACSGIVLKNKKDLDFGDRYTTFYRSNNWSIDLFEDTNHTITFG